MYVEPQYAFYFFAASSMIQGNPGAGDDKGEI